MLDLTDQKNNPTLTASGSGTVTLWECQKDGMWKERPLPFKIPAEQAAGPSSDPGRYMNEWGHCSRFNTVSRFTTVFMLDLDDLTQDSRILCQGGWLCC
jgi:hypothetical protein